MATSFSGLESARQALMASQTALQVTSQNISNSSTAGYTRQRLNLESVGPDIGGGKFASSQPAVGEGVAMNGVQQIRNTFLDSRYRSLNSGKGMWDDLQTNLSQIEDIFNEFSDSSSDDLTGLSGQISTLLSNLSKLQSSPTDENLASSVKSSIDTICATVKSDTTQLGSLLSQIKDTLDIDIEGGSNSSVNGDGGVNAIVSSISKLNTQIANYEVGGQSANELRDQRNNLLDQLSGYFDITVSEDKTGMVSIGLSGDTTGNMLIDSSNKAKSLQMGEVTDSGGKTVTAILWKDSGEAAKVTNGSAGAALQIINGTGQSGDDNPEIGIPAMQNMLDDFAKGFTKVINDVFDANKSTAYAGKELMTYDSTAGASSMSVSDDWGSDPSMIIKAYTGSSNADYIAQYTQAFNDTGKITFNGSTYSGTIQDFTDSISTNLAQRLSYVKTEAKLSDSSVQSLSMQRQSVSGVSIDEEGVNIIKYEQSYNAAARVITVINDMLETLIKNTGV